MSDLFKGIMLANLGVFSYAMLDVLFKWLVVDYHVIQIIFFRFLFGILILLAWILPRGIKQYHTKRKYNLHIYRFIVMFIAIVFSTWAIKMLPLAQFTVLNFSFIFFTVILAALFLSETVGLHRILALIIGFVGVIFVLQPENITFGMGGVFAIISAFAYALSTVFTKKITDTESAITITFYYTIMGLVVSVIFIPFFWKPVTLFDLFLFFLIAMGGTIVNISLAQAIKHIPVYLVSFFDYGSILWATIFGYIIWSEIPTIITIYGACIIIMSGIYIIIREKIQHKNKTYQHET